MEIKKCTSTHYTRTRNAKIKYLVMHYTGSTHSEPGTAVDTAKYFANATRPASADFICDDKYAVQYNPDIKGRCCYAVGGTGNPKKYKSPTSVGGRLYGKVTNDNSISIEMRSSKVNRKSVKDTDTDWYLTEGVEETAAELAAYLLKKYDIPFSNMVMHHETSYYSKLCPIMYCQKESDLKKWEAFKKKVKKYMGKKDKDDDVKTVTKVDKDKTNPTPPVKVTSSKRSKKEVVKALQTALNKDYTTPSKLAVDGDFGDRSAEKVKAHNIKKGSKGEFVKWLQITLNELGYKDNDGKKLSEDKSFGEKTRQATIKLQAAKKLSKDGVVGVNTVKAILKSYK